MEDIVGVVHKNIYKFGPLSETWQSHVLWHKLFWAPTVYLYFLYIKEFILFTKSFDITQFEDILNK